MAKRQGRHVGGHLTPTEKARKPSEAWLDYQARKKAEKQGKPYKPKLSARARRERAQNRAAGIQRTLRKMNYR